MKRIVRLTENDLNRLVKRVISEESDMDVPSAKEGFENKVNELVEYMSQSGMDENDIYNELTKTVQDKLDDFEIFG